MRGLLVLTLLGMTQFALAQTDVESTDVLPEVAAELNNDAAPPTGIEDLDLSDIESELGSAALNVEPEVSATATANELGDSDVSATLPTSSSDSTSLIPEQPAVEVIAEPLSSDGRMSESFEDAQPEDFSHNWYISGIYGGTGYQASNVESDSTLGFAVGVPVLDDKMVIEATFTTGQFFIEDANPLNTFLAIDKMQQSNIGVGLKAPLLYGRIFNGRVQPYVGAVVTYTKRDFSEQSVNQAIFGRGDWDSDSVDMGLSFDTDFHVNKAFSIGLSYRFMFNVSSSRDDNDFFNTNTGEVIRITPIEETDYYQLGLNGKFKF